MVVLDLAGAARSRARSARLLGSGRVDEQAIEGRVASKVLKITLGGNEAAELGIQAKGQRELLECPASIRRQAPVASQVVMEQRVLGIVTARTIERVNGLSEPVRALVTPTEGQGDSRIAGPQACCRLKWL